MYCHYVAGLVGIGLSDLFVASGLQRMSVMVFVMIDVIQLLDWRDNMISVIQWDCFYKKRILFVIIAKT